VQFQVIRRDRLTVLDELGEEGLVGQVAVVLLEELLIGRQRPPSGHQRASDSYKQLEANALLTLEGVSILRAASWT
jgi:hypothetical protein